MPADESNETRYYIYDENHFFIRLGEFSTNIEEEFKKIIEEKLIDYHLTLDDVITSYNPSFLKGLTNFQIKLDLLLL